MNLHELRPPAGSTRSRKRVGRGISSGQGKTCGRGQKGQFAREHPGLPAGFEGGQLPLTQRIPKLRGFSNRWRKEYCIVNVGKLDCFDGSIVVDPPAFKWAGLLSSSSLPIKLLGSGDIKRPLTVRVHSASAAARRAVEAAGGTVELLTPPAEAPEKADAGHSREGAARPAAADRHQSATTGHSERMDAAAGSTGKSRAPVADLPVDGSDGGEVELPRVTDVDGPSSDASETE